MIRAALTTVAHARRGRELIRPCLALAPADAGAFDPVAIEPPVQVDVGESVRPPPYSDSARGRSGGAGCAARHSEVRGRILRGALERQSQTVGLGQRHECPTDQHAYGASEIANGHVVEALAKR